MADIVYSTVNDFGLINSTLSAKNFTTKTLASTDRFLQYDANDDLAGGGLIPGGSIYYGGIIVMEVEFPASAVGTGVDLIRNNATAQLLVQEAGGGTIEVVASLMTNPVTTTNVCDGARRIIAGAVAGDAANKFAQIWVDGAQEDATTAAAAFFPAQLVGWTPTNEQNVIRYGFRPLTEAVESQADLTALIEQCISAFNSWNP